eukprot:jgi/Botrbrau1/21000/Bobra.0144s0018.1
MSLLVIHTMERLMRRNFSAVLLSAVFWTWRAVGSSDFSEMQLGSSVGFKGSDAVEVLHWMQALPIIYKALRANATSPSDIVSQVQRNLSTPLSEASILAIENWVEALPEDFATVLGNASSPSFPASEASNSSESYSPAGSQASTDPAYNWPNWGNGILNTRFAKLERRISPYNAASLASKRGWPVKVFGDVSATPTVVNGTVYVVDWGDLDYFKFSSGAYLVGNGHLTAIDADTGRIKWTREVRSYTGVQGVSRTSPAIEGDILVIGTLHSQSNLIYLPNSTFILAVNATTGDLLWKTMVDPHPLAGITLSPTIYDGGIYAGVSSAESAVRSSSDCCSFKGSILKLDLYTGKVLWRFQTMPDGDFYGGALWGSSPSIDVKRNQVYFGTGQNYKVPPEVKRCYQQNEGNITAQAACNPPENHIDSILALDLDTGKLRWSRRFAARDIFLIACAENLIVRVLGYNCSGPFNPPNADQDFGQVPMLILGKNGKKDMLVVGQKTAIAWALDPDNGDILWGVDLGGASQYGGMEFGSATDGERIYMSNQNAGLSNQSVPLINPPPRGQKTALGGFLTALDLDGNILWQTANPFPAIIPIIFNGSPLAALNVGPVTVANNVVYWPSYDIQGRLLFVDARTGQLLGSFPTGQPFGSLEGGASVADGTVYVGAGFGVAIGLPGPSVVWGLTTPGVAP